MEKKFLIFFLFIFLISCKKTDDVYYNFTDDDLGWIYFTQKTSDFQTYTLKYLYDNIDTLSIDVITRLEYRYHKERISSVGLHSKYKEYFEYGEAHYFTNSSFIENANVEISKREESVHIEGICLDCGNYSYEYLCSHGNFIPQMVIDTATVNNKTYGEVYKFSQVNETIKVVYFAKTYGFIKIELNDGNKLELIANH